MSGPCLLVIRRGGAALLAVVVTCMLCGCWDRVEVNDLATITAAGVDQYSDKLIELSLQIYTPPRGSSSSDMSGGSETIIQNQSTVISATGVNIADAVSRIQAKVPRLLFWGQNEVFVLGHELVKKSITGHLDYFLRVPQIRGSAMIFVSRTSAKEILTLSPGLRSNSADVLEESENLKIGLSMSIGNLNIMFAAGSGTGIMPSVEVMPAPEGQESNKRYPAITGCAVMKEEKLAGYIDDKAMRGVMWFRNEIDLAIATIITENVKKPISVRLNRAKTKLKPRINNGVWEMKVEISTREILVQNTSAIDVSELKGTRFVEAKLKQEIEKRMNRALNLVQKKFNADVLGFGEAFHRKYPKIWNKEQGNWEKIFPQVKVTYEIKTVIINPGKRGAPTRSPDNGEGEGGRE